MTFEEYQKEARKTAVFPEHRGLEYTALGLTGEAGEVADKVKKVIRDNDGYCDQSRKEELAKELGDVMWYMSMVSDQLGIKLEDIAKMNVGKLKERQTKGTLKGSGDNR